MRINSQQEFKVYISQDGSVKILDPDMTLVPFLKKANPDFSVQSAPPPAGYTPNFQRSRRMYIPDINVGDLEHIETEKLWDIHNRILEGDLSPSKNKDMANLLELKEELCRRIYLACSLCPWECGVNRFKTVGRCNLKDKAFFSSIFTHISEEAVINPAINLKLIGCSIECIYCHTWENLDVDSHREELKENIWRDMTFDGASTLEFVGGEPVVNLLSVLEILNFAPYNFGLPIVWNTNGWQSELTSSLLQGVIDVYLPDLKYGNDSCACKLSDVNNYSRVLRKGIETMVKVGVKTVVRILILPGHIECCHQPAIEWLAQFKGYKNLWVSLLDQYVPEYKAINIKELNRCLVPEEIKYVEYLVERNGLRDINMNPEGFWT